MKAATLQRLLEANPFQPFSINLADRRSLLVPHRDFVSPSPNYRMLTVWHPDDSCDIVDLMLVLGFHVKRQRKGRSKSERRGGR